jgi:hypothetical protein
MFLAVHAAIGALVGVAMPHPVLSFSAGVVSHFLTDLIPHGDDDLYQEYKKGNKKLRAYLHVAVDAVVTIGLVFSMFWFRDFVNPAAIIAGVVGGVLPDVLVGLCEVLKPRADSRLYRALAWFHGVHMKNHRHVIHWVMDDKKDISEIAGFVMQGGMMALLLLVLF